MNHGKAKKGQRQVTSCKGNPYGFGVVMASQIDGVCKGHSGKKCRHAQREPIEASGVRGREENSECATSGHDAYDGIGHGNDLENLMVFIWLF